MIEKIFTTTLKKTIVTANQRQARYLTNRYQRHIKNGPSPINILAWESWISQIFYSLNNQQILLSQQQTNRLWYDIIDTQHPHLLPHQIQHLSHLSEQGWRLAKEWLLKHDELYFSHHESEKFHTYCQAFKTYCQTHSVVDDYLAIEYCLGQVNQLHKMHVQFYGFQEITPLRRQLIEQLKTNTHHIEILDENIHQQTSPQQYHHLFNDFFEEIEAALDWAKKCHQKGETVAIIVPSLSRTRGIISSLAAQHFFECQTPFNISLPERIDQQPFILHLINYLSWQANPLPASSSTCLIQSPYFKLLNTPNIAPAIRLLESNIPLSITTFKSTLAKRGVADQLGDFPTHPKKTLTHWVNDLLNHLQHISWQLQNAHQQITFHKLLDTLLSLDTTDHLITFDTFLHLFKQCSANISKPDQPKNDGIQILQIKEAIGIEFDHTWLVQMHNQYLPATVNTHPWIGPFVQQQHKVSDACEKQQYELAQHFLKRLKLQTKHALVMSFSDHDMGRLNSCSPLFNTQTNQLTTQPIPNQTPPLLESLNDWAIQKKQVMRHVPITSVDTFLNCPFKHFCNQQLGLKQVQVPPLGLSSVQQGNLLHQALEILYTDSTLKPYNAQTPQQCIEKADSIKQYTATIKNELVKKNLINHLTHQLVEFIKHEATMPKPRQTECEKNIELTLNNITFNGCIDRVDQHQNGQYHIIDYKYTLSKHDTFKVQPLFETLTMMQLPLYALAIKNTQQINWYIFKPEGFKIVGTQSECCTINQTIINKWQKATQTIAHNIQSGDRTPTPKANVCRQCAYENICRVKAT